MAKSEAAADIKDLAFVNRIEAELGEFYEDARLAEHMDLVNDALHILQQTKLADNSKELFENMACIFEAHLPELETVFKKLEAKNQEVKPADN